jgi:hypothetical protein
MTEDLIRAFRNIFIGYEKAHGQHELFAKAEEGGKIKGRARTVSGEATLAAYRDHLSGTGASLGLIPLLDDDTCWFGGIDIDIQGEIVLRESIEALEKRVRELELPLVVCRTKSGGAHLYCFASQPISAKILVRKLAEFASLLGYGGCEVFPKQTMRVDDKDVGNWINIAMFGATSTGGSERYAVRHGKHLRTLAEFNSYAESMRISQKALAAFTINLTELFSDGPPCLQHITTFGLEKGTRNMTLTNVCIYFMKRYPEAWQDHVMKFNFECVKPSLDAQEVTQIIKNMSKKEYFYTCKQPPLCNHCDKKECVKREFGVANGSQSDSKETFDLDNLTRCISKDSVRWYAEHQGCRVELTTEQLMSPAELQKIFIEKFMRVIIPGKRFEWHERLAELMQTCNEVIEPDDASTQGQFENLLDNFFSASRPARNKDELIKGNSYTTGGRIHFRSEDLFNYLSVRRFNHKPHDIWIWLKSMGATATQLRVKGKLIRVWSLPEPERFDGSELSLPTQLVEEL